MNLTASSLKNPAAIGIAVALMLLFGFLSFNQLPIQLFPDIERPQMSIQTFWRAASPQEIESEILEPQEEVLRGLPGLENFNANANQGGSFINLTFSLNTDMQQTLIEVISRLNRLPPLPRDAVPPQVFLGGGFGGGGPNAALSWFFIQLLPDTPGPIQRYVHLLEDVVRPKIEAVPGVATVAINAGAAEELQIIIDPFRAAELGVQIPTIAGIAGQANDISGGFVDVGRRQYTLRFSGRYHPEDLSELVLDWRDGRPVKLGDIAQIEVKRGDRGGFSSQNGNSAISIRVDRQSEANVLETLNAVKEIVAELREGILKDNGLTMHQSFDSSVFIYRAINLVTSNLVIGVLLAVAVLWWFLRRFRATLLVAVAIPISLLSTFIFLNLTGRSLNVISLAGLAFAVGMVLDAAIVVLENIVRLREKGRDSLIASEQGATQVWGALLASTATTVAIFLPVIFIQDVEGQLFSDLALTIAIAVSISLLVAVIVLPVIAFKFLPRQGLEDRHVALWHKMTRVILKLTANPKRRWSVILSLMLIPITASIFLLPQLDYLPPVKRDAVDGFFNMPTGANIDFIEKEIHDPVVERLKPYMDGTKEPALKNYYLIFGGSQFGTIGARVKDQSRVKELEKIMREEIMVGLPDTQVFVLQGNLFGNFGGSRNIVMSLQSKDKEQLLQVARQGMQLISQAIPGAQVQPFPRLNMAQPELRLSPNDRRLVETGFNRASMGTLIRTLGDGQYIGEYFDGDKRMNIILRSEDWENPEELATIPIVTPSGAIVQMGDLVGIERTVGPSQIFRVDGRRTINLSFNPPDGMTLGEAVDILEAEVEPVLRNSLPVDGAIRYGGSADSLKQAVNTMLENFAMALFILFMLMSALFRSMKDSLLVVLSIPLATVGGVSLINIMSLPLDLLTMIGFIILLGLVVNNAILLVHQTRLAERRGSTRRDAVEEALHLRMRPIFMSTLTSIFGMLPLLLIPGEGSVIYRGLAAVIVGGMSVSTLFTLILLPSLLRLGEKVEKKQEKTEIVELTHYSEAT